jgi:hypothetical protein
MLGEDGIITLLQIGCAADQHRHADHVHCGCAVIGSTGSTSTRIAGAGRVLRSMLSCLAGADDLRHQRWDLRVRSLVSAVRKGVASADQTWLADEINLSFMLFMAIKYLTNEIIDISRVTVYVNIMQKLL